jgi:hypothetical protein
MLFNVVVCHNPLPSNIVLNAIQSACISSQPYSNLYLQILIKTTESPNNRCLWMTLFSSSSPSPVAWAQAKVSSSNTFGRLILWPTSRTQTAQHSPRPSTHYALAPHVGLNISTGSSLPGFNLVNTGTASQKLSSQSAFLVGTSYILGFSCCTKFTFRSASLFILFYTHCWNCYDLAKIRLLHFSLLLVLRVEKG